VAFPSIAGVVGTAVSTAALDPAINIGSPSNGQLVIILFTSTSTHGSPVVAPSGWTHLIGEDTSTARPSGDASSGDKKQILYRYCDGSEGATVNVDTSATSVKAAAIAARINGADPSAPPEISTGVAGNGTGVNAGSVTPSGGPKDFLFLICAAQEGTGGAPASPPTNYTHPSPFSQNCTGGGSATNARVAMAYRQLNTASAEDPAIWTWPASEDWSAWTIAVHPAAAAATSLLVPRRRVYTGR
jgi:hypothetical protein